MDDSYGYTRFAAHLNSKKAGPLVCPICKATESFEARGTLAGSSSDPLASSGPPTSPESQFNYATCTHSWYTIFFVTGALPLPE